MIDFLKIKITNANVIEYFYTHSLLYFKSKKEILLIDKETIVSKKTRQYKGILFEFTENSLFIHFKPHYYFNNNVHNANDFSVLNCIKTLKEFVDTFNIHASQYEIINIEFGLNILLPTSLIDVKDLLIYLIYHEQNDFRSSKEYPYCRYSSSTSKKGSINVYKIIKAYAKGIQFPNIIDINTWRFEVKSNRKKYIQSLNIYTLEDLMNINIYNILSETILKEFDKVLIIDDNTKPNLTKTKLKNFKKKLNPITWHKLKFKSKNTFKDNFTKYYDALNICDTHLKKEIRKLIFDKLTELKKCANLRLYIDEQGTFFINRKCLVTGLNISMQKDDSILLSHTGLKYYYETDINKYKIIKNKYLSTTWINSDYETQIKEIAHNIRNYNSNQRIKQQKLYPPHQNQLFEIAV